MLEVSGGEEQRVTWVPGLVQSIQIGLSKGGIDAG